MLNTHMPHGLPHGSPYQENGRSMNLLPKQKSGKGGYDNFVETNVGELGGTSKLLKLALGCMIQPFVHKIIPSSFNAAVHNS